LFSLDSVLPWSWSFTAPEGDGYYEFYSLATDDDGNTESAPTTADASCGVDTSAPDQPALISPVDGEMVTTSTPVLDWGDVSDLSGVSYEIEISTDNTFADPVLSKSGIVVSEYSLTSEESLADGTYFWRIRVVNGSELTSEWSVAKMFIAETAPNAVLSVGAVSAESVVNLDLTPYNIFIVNVALTLKQDVENLSVGIKEYESEEFLTLFDWAPAPSGITYKYYGLVSPSMDHQNVTQTVVKFRVLREWIENNQVENIRLLKLVAGEWEEVETEYLTSDNEYDYFTAEMSGFSSILAAAGTQKPSIFFPVAPLPIFIIALLAMFAVMGGGLGYFIYMRKIKPMRPKVPLQKLARPVPKALPEVPPRVPPTMAPAVTITQLKPAPIKRVPAPRVPVKPISVTPAPKVPPVPPAEILKALEHVPARVLPLPPEVPKVEYPEMVLQQLKKVAKPVEPAVPLKELRKLREAPAVPIEKIERVARPVEPAVVLEELKRAARGAEKQAVQMAELKRVARSHEPGSLEKLRKLLRGEKRTDGGEPRKARSKKKPSRTGTSA